MRSARLLTIAPLLASMSLLATSARADDAPNVIIVEPAPSASTSPSPATSLPEAPVAPTVRPKFRNHWYGWQTLTFDGVAIVGGIGLGELKFKDAGWFWIGTYAIAPPVVHLAHGRVGIAFADLGLRVGAPTAGTLLGYAVACRNDNSLDDLGACIAGMALGFVVGYASAIAVDAAVLAREKVEITPADEAAARERERRKRASTFSILPDIGLGQNRATVGLHGVF